jgi:hypothetical protein
MPPGGGALDDWLCGSIENMMRSIRTKQDYVKRDYRYAALVA